MQYRAKWQVSLWVACLAIGAFFLAVPSASAGQCTKETRNLDLGQGVAGVRSYLCRTDSGLKVSVAFYRLDEISTAGLFKGALASPLRTILGDAPIEKNELYARLSDVFDRFGRQPQYEAEWNYSLSVPIGGGGAGGSTQESIWYVGGLSFIPLTNDVAAISNTLTFPPDLSFFYFSYPGSECRKYPLSCTVAWRYMTEADAAGFDDDMRRYNELLNIPTDPQDLLTDNYLKMLVYMAKDGWPEYLETVYGRFDECAGSFVFSYLGRNLLFDIAVIENVADRGVALDGLWGIASASDALRPTGEDTGSPGTLPLATSAIPPGGKLVVPLRFRLVAKKGIDWANLAEARRVQQQIVQGDENQVVAASDWETGFKKVRGAFGPPSSPTIENYVYGRAINLEGLVVGGERLVLEGGAANYLEFSIAFEGASCPYLYSWNGETWDSHGKVIVRANDPAKKRSETIAFSGLRHRFQLREEELEITYLDRINLSLRLKDGRTIARLPDDRRLVGDDEDYLLLHPGAVADLTFDTKGIEADEVEWSAFTVTGFYRPFSSIIGRSRISSSSP